ncbi:MAG: hypothetical protein WCA31_11780 [Acidimicrobiales bacterium]
MPVLHHFLIVFDHAKGELVATQDFGSDSDGAVFAYAEKENEYKGHDSIEIVLIGSDSLDTIRITHANYFDGSAAVGTSKYLAGI